MARTVSDARRRKAIAVVEASRRTHILWRDYLAEHPDCGDAEIAGDSAHHEHCIAGYDLVLEVLRRSSVSTFAGE